MSDLSAYAASFPVAAPADAHWTDRTVKQGHADYCAAYGHAEWIVDGVDQHRCPRCGTVTDADARAALITGETDTYVSPAAVAVAAPCTHWECALTGDACTLVPGVAREVLATAEQDGHMVTVTRDEPMSVGNGMPYTVVRVGGIHMGEVIGSRREDDGTLTARVRVPSGYDKLTVYGNGADFAAALAELAPHIVAAYRRTYPHAA